MFGIHSGDQRFFELFQQVTALLEQSCRTLSELMDDYSLLPQKDKDILKIEHEADEVTAAIIDLLNQTLVTPLDREDIYTLATVLDDIIDFVQGSIDRMSLYKVGQPSPGAKHLVRLLHDSAKVIHVSFGEMRDLKRNKQSLLNNAKKINALESEADSLYRQEVARLFDEEKNPIELIKRKEILEHIETAVDHCEDIADLIKGVVLKYA